MPAELGGSQISSLLEALPGIASVLRSPVADALVKAIRAAAGVGEFAMDDAEELVRYAVRRGLIGPEEGARARARQRARAAGDRRVSGAGGSLRRGGRHVQRLCGAAPERPRCGSAARQSATRAPRCGGTHGPAGVGARGGARARAAPTVHS